MFSFWKENSDPVPLKKTDRVGKEGICATGKPVAEETPLEDLVAPVPKGQKYGAE